MSWKSDSQFTERLLRVGVAVVHVTLFAFALLASLGFFAATLVELFERPLPFVHQEAEHERHNEPHRDRVAERVAGGRLRSDQSRNDRHNDVDRGNESREDAAYQD